MPEPSSSMPRVSVVMSVYNDADRVEQAVHGILDQTFRDLELIVVDDGSGDGSAAVLDRLAAEDSRMRVIHQDNTGLTRALIRGCNEARGEYIARQDSDDWSHPQRIAEQVDLLDRDRRLGFVSCTTEYIGPGNEHLSNMSRPSDPEAATRGLLDERQGPPAHGSVMFRKSLYQQVGGYRPEFHYSQDADLWLRMGERAWIGYVAALRYVALRELQGASGAHRSIQKRFGALAIQSSQARRAGESETPLLEQARQLAVELVASKSQTTALSREGMLAQAYLLGSQLVQHGDPRARKYLWQVIRGKPWHVRAWARLIQSWMRHAHH